MCILNERVAALARDIVERGTPLVPLDGVFATMASDEGLWWWCTDTSVGAECCVRGVYNESNIAGILLARCRYVSDKAFRSVSFSDFAFGDKVVPPAQPVLHKLGVRQFSQFLENVQHAFVSLVYGDRGDACACMSKFIDYALAHLGWLVSVEESETAECRILDDIENIQACGSRGTVRVTGQFVRRHLTFLHCAALHMYLRGNSCTADAATGRDMDSLREAIQSFHVESSTQDYYRYSMMSDCMPGAIVQYQHDFQGLYNDVSQVISFHKKTYERRRAPVLDDARSGRNAICTLSAMVQLYPEVEVVSEGVTLGMVLRRNVDAWILLPGCIYLVTRGGSIYSSDTIFQLAYVIASTRR